MPRIPTATPTAAATTEKQRKAAGVNELVKTIKTLTGLRIDHFLQVDLIGFYRISVAIGKVTVDLCERVDDSYSGLHLPAGINHIDGRDALAFVRQRHGVPGSDLGREKRQQYFLAAAYRKIASLNMLINPGKLSNLIDAVDKSIYLDDHFSITQLAEQMANLSADNIVGKTIPVEDEEVIDGMDVLVVDPAKVRQFVDELINGTTTVAVAVRSSGSSSTSRRAAHVHVHLDGADRRRLHPLTTPERCFSELLGTAGCATVRHLLRRGNRRAHRAVRALAGQLGGQDALPADRRTRPRRRVAGLSRAAGALDLGARSARLPDRGTRDRLRPRLGRRRIRRARRRARRRSGRVRGGADVGSCRLRCRGAARRVGLRHRGATAGGQVGGRRSYRASRPTRASPAARAVRWSSGRDRARCRSRHAC